MSNGSLPEYLRGNPDVDKLLNAARGSTDPAVRLQNYNAARAILSKESPIIYLYDPTWIYAMGKGVTGFVPYPDGLIRLAGVAKS